MFENLENTQVGPMTDADLLIAMGTEKKEEKSKDKTKVNNPSEDDTKDEIKNTDKTKGKKTNGKETKVTKSKDVSDPKKEVTELSKKDLDIAAGIDDDDDDIEEENDDETENEDDDNIEKENQDKKKKKKDDAGEEDEDKTDDENSGGIEIGDFLKARVELLIKKGEWTDFEGREDIEWDEDTFAEIELKQREVQRDELKEELLGSFGRYGREIAEYTANGGDPEKLIDIFKEQQVVLNLSIETEDQQKAVVLKYATEFQDMTPKRATQYVNGLIADKEIEDAAKEAKTKMEASLKAEEKALKEEQEAFDLEQKTKTKTTLDKFSKDATLLINSDETISADEKKELLKVLTKFDKKLSNGVPVNDFYFKFAEFRKNLPDYIQLVRFVMNPKKYIKTAENKGKTKANEKAFNLIRTNNQIKKTKSSSPDNQEKGEKKSTFKLLY